MREAKDSYLKAGEIIEIKITNLIDKKEEVVEVRESNFCIVNFINCLSSEEKRKQESLRIHAEILGGKDDF